VFKLALSFVKKITEVIEKMTKISGSEYHGGYTHYSCSIVGYLIYLKRKYFYNLNAGGWIMLSSVEDKGFIYLACKNPKYFKYFIDDSEE
jgi:hypothetical protein